MDLFAGQPTRVAQAPLQQESPAELAERTWPQVAGREPLADTLSAISRLPEKVREAVLEVCAHIYRSEFFRLTELAPMRRTNDIASSAQMSVFSAVSHLAEKAFHLADAPLLTRIARELQLASNLEPACRILDEFKSVNLFIAALETDDRDSYLRAAKELVRRQPVKFAVLDAELIEWNPTSEFLAACSEIGVRPSCVGIADRSAAASHSMLQTDSKYRLTPALYLDSEGRRLEPDAGGVLGPLTRSVATRQTANAPIQHEPPAALRATAPTTAIQARIESLRQSQARRGPRP